MNPLKASASTLLAANVDARRAIAEASHKCWGDPNRQQEYNLLLNAADALDTHRDLVLLLDRQTDQCIRALERVALMDEVRANTLRQGGETDAKARGAH